MPKVTFLNVFVTTYLGQLERRNFRMMLFGLLAAITLTLGSFLPSLQFDFEFEKLFPSNDPDTRLYRNHIEEFGLRQQFMFVMIENDHGLFKADFLEKIKNAEKDLTESENVKSVVSPVSMKRLISGPMGLVPLPLMHLDDTRLQADSSYIFSHPVYSQSFSKDRTSLLLFLSHEVFFTDDENSDFSKFVHESFTSNQIDDYKIVGPLEAQLAFIQYIKNDFSTFLIGSVLLSFLLLMAIFRDLKSAILPFILSILSVVWLFGIISMLGVKINLLSALLPPIVFFVAMSDVIHLMNGFKKSGKLSKLDKMKEAMLIVWRPTLLTSITTAIGFLSLLWINTEPIQQMGVFAALGVLIAFLLTFTIGILYVRTVVIKSQAKISISEKYPKILTKHSKPIVVVMLIFLAVAIPGISFLSTNAYILDDLPEDSKIRMDFDLANEQLGGVKDWEARVEVVDTTYTLWSPKIISELIKFEEFLEQKSSITRIQSPIGLIKLSHSIYHNGDPDFYKVPEETADLKRASLMARRLMKRSTGNMILKERITRISGFSKDAGTNASLTQTAEIQKFIREELNEDLIQVRLTGPTFLIDKANHQLSVNLIIGLGTALMVIALFLGIYFRSWKLLLISLIPNLLPLIAIAGIVGWMGITLKMTTAIIFTVAFGIAVDDTIHFMSYYVQNINSKDPIKETFKHAGSAMLITSIVMISGFSLFMLSDFGATYYMGLFVSMALLIALIIDFTLLPLLMKKYVKKVKSWRSN